jgi:two-component system, sensor histidine kinase FlrB
MKASPPGDGRESEAPAKSALLLAGAFSEFISASSRLEASYRQLQDEVSDLRLELAARNAALTTSLAENERMRQEREAARKAMALAELTTVLAHEIRNPLASLELFAELIENDSAHRPEWISNLRAGIRSLSATVNNVLTFHGSRSLKLALVDLGGLICNAIQFVQPLAHQAAVALRWLDDGNRNLVMGNESALQQVVLNLISNAIRHTPSGGTVTVSICDAEDENVIVEFSDTGCGIRADQIDHIFEPGFSGSGDTSGLGLAVCERIVKQHGGGISVASRVDQGARFALSLPRLAVEVATA